ncbi:MAG: hypothetical protein J6J35_02130 [Alphaproteobacteria bacterium]|nr:hypothetical protein [Alphaproteobacteria bacterium]MBP3687147.1 hypothetical protein [Alphaproteobacteria bacterium]
MNKNVVAILGIIGAGVFIGCAPMLWETNIYGNYQIKQAAGTGKITVRNDAGLYWQGFGDIETYPVSEDIDFEESGMKVRFNDGSIAPVKGTVKFRLSLNEDKQKILHRDYGNFENVKRDLIQKNVAEALSQAATLMAAEDSYSTRRAEFADAAKSQLEKGIFKTTSKLVDAIDENGTKFRKLNISIARDENGEPIIQKPSLLNDYGIEILQFVVNDFDYDPKVQELIDKKKEANQMKVVSTANAEKAKQDAITAEEQGKARVAEAKANAEVEKITAVVEAEKKADVAKLQALQAKYEAEKVAEIGKAEAEVARQKVAAGLSPLEKATLEKETAIGIAKEIANVKFPETMVIAGGGKEGGVSPWDAVGLNQMMEITAKIKEAKIIK